METFIGQKNELGLVPWRMCAAAIVCAGEPTKNTVAVDENFARGAGRRAAGKFLNKYKQRALYTASGVQ